MTITLVTGANKGIGRETARRLADIGHTVYLGAQDPGRGQAAAQELGARFVQLDVTDDASVAAALDEIREREGRLDVLVNNAGIASWALDGPGALALLDVNVAGVVRVTQAALPLLEKSPNPLVVNVSSSLGSFWAVTNPERQESHVPAGVYAASKAAVTMLTVQYAKAYPGIRFNAVEPGYTDTELGGAQAAAQREAVGFTPGRPVSESVGTIVRMATLGPDGPTGTLQEDAGQLAF